MTKIAVLTIRETMKPRAERSMDPSQGNSFLRLLLAYIVGVNAFGLVLALTYAIGTLFFHMANGVALIGAIGGAAVGVAAGVRTGRALRGLI